ncbi:MAG: isocitrate lyase/phosphoenolpyruvate mutase family protein [Chloroflexi bacterium]|nr:isocitrate lyase/phosphoenolpyruvate mutase family protein [Chloroflexota bacterium]
MNKNQLRQKAENFLAYHHATQLLILPNAWDVSSAKVFALEGFKAIGTTSAGIAASLGYPDGQRVSLAETIAVVERIEQQIDLPISVDIEAGYATTLDDIAAAARAVLNVGAVGLNLEDSTGQPANPLYETAVQKEKLCAIREMAEAEGVHLVINARTDVYLISNESPEARLRQAIARGNAYKEAGADCIFVPDTGDLDKDSIAHLVREIDAPINIIAGVTTPPIAELEKIGVARVSLGPRPMRATLTLLQKIAQELLELGTYDLMTSASITYAEVNQWFERN